MRNRHLLILGLVCIAFFILGNAAADLTSPDEVFYSQTAREMAERGTWLTPYLFGRPQFEKPVLLYWLLRIAGGVLGFTSFSMRLFPALFGLLGVGAVYVLASLGFGNERKAFLSGLILASSFLFVGLARTVFTDMIFCVWILISLTAFYWGYRVTAHRSASILLFFAFAGLAALTKGPLGIALPLLVAVSFLVIRGKLRTYSRPSMAWGLLLCALICVPWYALMMVKYGGQFTHEFFYNDHWRRLIEAEHHSNDTWYFYPVSLVGGMFPWSLFVVAGGIRTFRMGWRNRSRFHVFVGLYLLAVFLVFQTAHSKLASYVFPAYPALALMAGDCLVESGSTGRAGRGLRAAGVVTGLLVLALVPSLLIAGQTVYGVVASCGRVARVILALVLLASVAVGTTHVHWSARGNVLKGSYALLFVIPIVLLTFGAVWPDVGPYLSSKRICRRFTGRETGQGTVLCSKSFLRAVRYYTGREVAWIAIGKGDFFSPHPAPMLTDAARVRALLRRQGVTYCIVDDGDAERLEAVAAGDFRCASLDAVGDARIVRIELLRQHGAASKDSRKAALDEGRCGECGDAGQVPEIPPLLCPGLDDIVSADS